MSSFSRALRLALKYRFTVAGAVISALIVAVLWGANIGAAYPCLKVVLRGQSLQQWLAQEVDSAKQKIDGYEKSLAAMQASLDSLPEKERRTIAHRIEKLQPKLAAERMALSTYTWAQPYADRYIPHDPFRTVVLFIFLLLAGTIVKDVFVVMNNILAERLSMLATLDLRKLFYRRTLRMDMAAFNDEGTSDLMSRFTYDVESVSGGISSLFGKLVREPLKMVACLAGAAFICWRLLLLSLVVAPIAGLLINWLGKMLKRANRKAMEEMAQIYAKLEETFRAIKIVKAFTGERFERKRFHDSSKAFFRKSMKIARYDSLAHPMTELMGMLTICLALVAGAWLVLTGETRLFGITMSPRAIDLESLLLFFGLLAGAADPIRKFSDVFNRLQRGSAAADRIYARLDREPQVRDPHPAVKIERHHRDIVFENVSFGYRSDMRVLEEVVLRIPFGKTFAIVGPNGCGKSTLASLVPRFYDATAGRVLIDGVGVTEMRQHDLRAQISIVTQETLLFDDTVLNNIRYGCPDATREDVIRAAKQAHAHDFILNALPEGYDTVVGTLGGRLSGGQRQRIALARAILRDPAILILDEATSQVDLESEQAIQDALVEFIRNRTTLIITHRMAALALADQIVVMQDGRIQDVGTHAELLARCPLYRRLYQIQFEEPPQSAAA